MKKTGLNWERMHQPRMETVFSIFYRGCKLPKSVHI